MPAWGIYQISRQENSFYKLHIQSEQIPPLFAPEKIPCGKNRFTSNQLYFYMMKEINYRIFNNRYLMPQQTAEKKHQASDDKMQKPPDETDYEVLWLAKRAWDNLDKYRHTRTRSRNYTFGNQWSDTINLPDGRSISEEQYLKEQGKVPLKNNLIRKLVKNVVGQFRAIQTQPVCIARNRQDQPLSEILSSALQYVHQHNHLWEIDGRSLEEFLISGSCFHKIEYGKRNNKNDVWIDEVNPNRIFFNSMEDSRHWDCTLIGELHDAPIAQVLSHFAHGSRKRATELREIYCNATESQLRETYENLSSEPLDNIDFFMPTDKHLCRIIEVWRLENRERLMCHDTLTGRYYKEEIDHAAEIEEENQRRISEARSKDIAEENVPLIHTEWFIDQFWYYRFFTPFGEILAEGETPYWHGEHPYTFKLYPLIDGEIHSFVEDIIDQQRYINRLITLVDFIMGSSAKGVLLFPENQIPDGMTIEDIAEEWTRYNGVILFKPKPGEALPQQIAINATNIGAYELLNLQMQLLDNISGVHGAMQGQAPSAGTPADLYSQQVQNAGINLIDIFESFKSFRERRDTKLLKTIQQYYDRQRYIDIAGDKIDERNIPYTPDEVQHAEVDINITESTSSPVFRSASNEFLLQLFRMGHISLEMLLENGAFPFSDRLLQSIEKQKQEQQEILTSALQAQQTPTFSQPMV